MHVTVVAAAAIISMAASVTACVIIEHANVHDYMTRPVNICGTIAARPTVSRHRSTKLYVYQADFTNMVYRVILSLHHKLVTNCYK